MFRSLRMSSTVHQRSGAADTNRCGLEGHVHSRQSQLPVKSLSAPFLQDMYQRHPATPAVLVRGMFGAASQARNGKQDKRQCCNMHRWGRWHDALHRQDRQHKQHLLPEQPYQQPSCAVARVAQVWAVAREPGPSDPEPEIPAKHTPRPICQEHQRTPQRGCDNRCVSGL